METKCIDKQNTNWTYALNSLKNELAESFSIHTIGEAAQIINKMKQLNSKQNTRSALSNWEPRIFKIVKGLSSYKSKYCDTKGKILPLSQCEAFLAIDEGQRGWISGKRNNAIICEYQTYIGELPSTDALDAIFLDRLNAIYKEYKSSSDYMSRLVIRRLREISPEFVCKKAAEDEKKDDAGFQLDENGKRVLLEDIPTTRLLILKQLIKVFGWMEGINNRDFSSIGNDEKNLVEKDFHGDYHDIDESIFDVLKDGSAVSSDESEIIIDNGYINAVSKLQGTIRYKAPIILFTKHIGDNLRQIVNDDILKDNFDDAVFVSDCFKKSCGQFAITDFKNYKTMDVAFITSFNDQLKTASQKGYLLPYTQFPYKERLQVIMNEYLGCIELAAPDAIIFEFFADAFKQDVSPQKMKKLISVGKAKKLDFSSLIDGKTDIMDYIGISYCERLDFLLEKYKHKITHNNELYEKIISVRQSMAVSADTGESAAAKKANILTYIKSMKNTDAQIIPALVKTIEDSLLERNAETDIKPGDPDAFFALYTEKEVNNSAVSFFKLFDGVLKTYKSSGGKPVCLADLVDVSKIDIDKIPEDKLPGITEKLETLLIRKSKKLKKNFISGYTRQIGALYNRKVTVSYADWPAYLRLIVICDRYAEKIPATDEIMNAIKNVLCGATVSYLADGDYPVKLDDILVKNKDGMPKILEININNPITLKSDELSEFLRIVEQEAYIDSDYESYLYARLGARYNEATKNDSQLCKENRANLTGARGRYTLLNIADTLAEAKFSAQGKTKEYIYIFAVAFGMTSSFAENDKTNKETDIQQNLFIDYYNDNIVNRTREMFIYGYGINYKNYAEVTFLWVIAQNNLSGKEKLKTAYDIINYCKANGKETLQVDFLSEKNESGPSATEVYKLNFYNTLMELKRSDELQEHLITHYPVSSSVNMMELNSKTETANEALRINCVIVNQILRFLENEKSLYNLDYEDNNPIEFESRLRMYDLLDFFKEYLYLRNRKCKNCTYHSIGNKIFPDCMHYSSACDEYFEAYNINCDDRTREYREERDKLFEKCPKTQVYFENQLLDFNNICNASQTELKYVLDIVRNRLSIDAEEGVCFKEPSRFALVSICYYVITLLNHIQKRMQDGAFRPAFRNFGDFYKVFCEGKVFRVPYKLYQSFENPFNTHLTVLELPLNKNENIKEVQYVGADKLLINAGYQPINSKNIMDIYMIFLAYRETYLPIDNRYHSLMDDMISFFDAQKEHAERIKDAREFAVYR